MLNRQLLSLAVLLASGSAVLAKNLRENEFIIGGGSAEADGLRVAGPSFYVRQDRPGMVFSTVQRPGGPREYTFLFLFKGDERRQTLAKYDGKCRVIDATASSAGFIEIRGTKFEFSHKLDNGVPGKKPAMETLTVNGQTLDLRKGRVLLVDLSGPRAIWRQVDAPLPTNATLPLKVDEVETLAKQNLERLRKQNSEIRSFLK